MIDWKASFQLLYFGFIKTPMIFFARPRVVTLTDHRCEIKIRLRRRTRNHLNSMYFASLLLGADVAGGLLAMKLIRESRQPINLVFKDVQADFLKRVDADAFFTCADGQSIKHLVEQVVETGERQHLPLNISVTAPDKYGDEELARITLTLSLKLKY